MLASGSAETWINVDGETVAQGTTLVFVRASAGTIL